MIGISASLFSNRVSRRPPDMADRMALCQTPFHERGVLRVGWTEERFYCFGRVERGVLTVRFTYRDGVIRIIGAGFWRKGEAVYEQENNLHG
jgi:hypothetical protein